MFRELHLGGARTANRLSNKHRQPLIRTNAAGSLKIGQRATSQFLGRLLLDAFCQCLAHGGVVVR